MQIWLFASFCLCVCGHLLVHLNERERTIEDETDTFFVGSQSEYGRDS